MLKESKASRHVKRGQDTKIPQSSGPPEKVGDEAVHNELGSGPRCQDSILGYVNAQTRFEITSKQSNDPPLSRGMDNEEKDEKQSQDDKTGLGMEKTGQ
ncbi:hypothetical protein Tco_0207796, partial [Tanacetum coccineum]